MCATLVDLLLITVSGGAGHEGLDLGFEHPFSKFAVLENSAETTWDHFAFLVLWLLGGAFILHLLYQLVVCSIAWCLFRIIWSFLWLVDFVLDICYWLFKMCFFCKLGSTYFYRHYGDCFLFCLNTFKLMLYLYPLCIKLVWSFRLFFCYPITFRRVHRWVVGWCNTVYSSGDGDGVFEDSRMRDFGYKGIHINFLPLLNLNTIYIIIWLHRTPA